MISLVKNLKCISRLNIHYYPNRRYKSYITSLKAVIAGKSLISAGLDFVGILHFAFYIKFNKFTNNIGSGNFTNIFCQIPTNFKKGLEGRWGVGYTPPLNTPLVMRSEPHWDISQIIIHCICLCSLRTVWESHVGIICKVICLGVFLAWAEITDLDGE